MFKYSIFIYLFFFIPAASVDLPEVSTSTDLPVTDVEKKTTKSTTVSCVLKLKIGRIISHFQVFN